MNATTHDSVKGGIEGKFIECVYTRQKFQLHWFLIWLVGWLCGVVRPFDTFRSFRVRSVNLATLFLGKLPRQFTSA